MKKSRIVFTAFVALMILLPWFLTRRGYCRGDLEMREIFADVNDLRREINLINLVNGLYLSAEQMNQMLAILRKVEATRGEYQTKATSQVHEMEEILKELKEILGRNEEIDQGLIRKFHRAKKRGEDLREEFHSALMPYQDEMKRVLNGNQLALIEEFKPCYRPDLRRYPDG
jgi:DNA mismatch repair ATPase MutS